MTVFARVETESVNTRKKRKERRKRSENIATETEKGTEIESVNETKRKTRIASGIETKTEKECLGLLKRKSRDGIGGTAEAAALARVARSGAKIESDPASSTRNRSATPAPLATRASPPAPAMAT